jgi:hypothetical protein
LDEKAGSVKIFVSWSGETSHKVALAIRDWLPAVIQQVAPWVSSEDLRKGSQWLPELSKELAETVEGIVCITSGNFDSSWLNYEAGALAKTTGQTRVRTALYGVTPSEIQGPLSEFQHTSLADKEDVRKLMQSINSSCEHPLADERLSRAFEREWTTLETELGAIAPTEVDTPPPGRDEKSMIIEILDIVRGLGRLTGIEETLAQLEARLATQAISPATRARSRATELLLPKLAERGALLTEELDELRTPGASTEFRKWVDNLIVRNAVNSDQPPF